jgi:hypothetical protein
MISVLGPMVFVYLSGERYKKKGEVPGLPNCKAYRISACFLRC